MPDYLRTSLFPRNSLGATNFLVFSMRLFCVKRQLPWAVAHVLLPIDSRC